MVYRFPGMDPWLEHPLVWPSVHHRMVTYLADDLSEKLLPRYVARPGEREALEVFGRAVVPDVVVARPRGRRSASTSTVLEAQAPVVVRLREEEVREAFVEIRDLRSGGRVVTVIELLSPSNKRGGSETRRQYRKKQRELLASDVNLVEIDLLRAGRHTVAIPRSSLGSLPPHHYLVVTRRAASPRDLLVYPVSVRSRLPRMSIPLLAPDPDVVVDLQTALERTYELGGYSVDLDYSKPPKPPLDEHDLAWARRVLARTKRTGRRSRG